MVVIGDFNTVQDANLDRNEYSVVNPKSTERINTLKEELILEDVWRVHHPTEKRYSWYGKRKKKNQIHVGPKLSASRIDYALISSGMCDSVHNSFYMSGIKTDHSAFFIGFNFTTNERGRSFWKLNTSVLSELAFVQTVNTEIAKSLEQNKSVNVLDKWELLKSDVKKCARKYCQTRASEQSLAISQLAEYVTEMESKFDSLDEKQHDLLENSKSELDELQCQKTTAAMFRSKSKWYMEGERNSKYFYNLERKRSAATVCDKVFKGNVLVENQEDVLEVQREFYQNLYSSDSNVKFQLCDNIDVKVPGDMIAASNDVFSEAEIQDAIKGMRNGSCPGPDGLPAEFYKVFWKKIKTPLLEALEESYKVKKLYPSARKGILNLIPKGEKDSRYLKNMRPITLLNVDYKVIEKAVANRMIPALTKIIHEDQRGFLPNRRITANIRRILDIVNYGESNPDEIDGFVMSCDFLKCFDRIEFEAVFCALKYFGFSTYLQQWIRTLYTEFSVKVQNNGNFSKKINVHRSVHQGGPASNALFLCVAELLAVSLRTDNEITVLYVKDILNLLNQYADDLDLILKRSQANLNRVFKKIEDFGRSTGFALSYDKTSMYRLGDMQKSNAELYTQSGMPWNKETINVLGIEISRTSDDVVEKNYSSVIRQTIETLNKWSNRQLSIIGKIEVINTLVASLYVYKMTTIPSMTDQMFKQVETEIEKFIWNGHKSKIPTEVLRKSKDQGGLALTNLKLKDYAIKSTWVHMLHEHMYPEDLAYEIINEDLKELIWACNLHKNDIRVLDIGKQHVFWEQVIEGWCMYHYSSEIETQHDQILWFNSNMRVQNKPVWWPKAWRAGLKYISQLFYQGDFIPNEELKSKFNLTHMESNTLKSAIPKILRQKYRCEELEKTDVKLRDFLAQPKKAKYIYSQLNKTPSEKVVKTQARWEQEFHMDEGEFDVCEMTSQIKYITPVIKLRSFQYRMLHRALVTKKNLHRWKIKDNNLCVFCKKCEETVQHIFGVCEKVIPIWVAAKQII